MAICMFCKRKLTRPEGSGKPRRTDKAVEHILKRQWIKALGHEQSVLWHGIEAKDVLVSERRPSALGFVTGEICYFCNSGWMQKVDARAGASLLALASGKAKPDLLSRRSRFDLARWAFKTACVLRYVAPPHMRHLPRHILDRAHEPTFLPRGFLAFCTIPAAQVGHHLGASSLDKWIASASELARLKAMPQSKRLKCAFQYDHIVIGCCWVTTADRPRFKLYEGFHKVLYESRVRRRYMTGAEVAAINFADVIYLSHSQPTNVAQVLIGIEFS